MFEQVKKCNIYIVVYIHKQPIMWLFYYVTTRFCQHKGHLTNRVSTVDNVYEEILTDI